MTKDIWDFKANSRRNASFWRKGQTYWRGHREWVSNDRRGNQERSENLPTTWYRTIGVWSGALTRVTQAQSTAPLDYASETPLTLSTLGHLISEPVVWSRISSRNFQSQITYWHPNVSCPTTTGLQDHVEQDLKLELEVYMARPLKKDRYKRHTE